MYKVSSKNGTVYFKTIEDAMDYVVSKSPAIFENGYVKISFVEVF